MAKVRFIFPNKPVEIINPKLLKKLNLDDWIVQPKWNGHRAHPFLGEDGRCTVLSRHGTPLTRAKAGDWGWLSQLPIAPQWQLDSEMTTSGSLIVWDYATMGGEDFARLPYEVRLKSLKALLDVPMGCGGHFIHLIETLPASRFEEILARRGTLPDLEGIVFKKKGATDLWGGHSTREVPSMIKYKFRR
jgi:ATP-dependent DNA ligase